MEMDVLLVVDMQNGVCEEEKNSRLYRRCINRVNKRIEAYRSLDKPIIFIQHNDESLLVGSEDWRIMSDISYSEEDIVIRKTHANAFYHTDLQRVLKSLNVIRLELCGAQTEYCVDATIKMAHGLGYELQMYKGTTMTVGNHYMSADETVEFYEDIWNKRFLLLISQSVN